LTLKCDAGEPGVISWKPDRNTPDTVYYHCFTHRYLGWKIHVHDACDSEAGGLKGSASERHEIRLPAESTAAEPAPVHEDYAGEASVRHETKVSANDNFLLKHQTDLIKNHNMNGTPPKLSFEITKSSEITKLISDGIRAAEALEESLLRNPTKPVNSNGAWDIPAIQCHEPEDGVFYAQMGPTGGKHGYPAITGGSFKSGINYSHYTRITIFLIFIIFLYILGHVGWGISWYINGLLIPEIHVVRGRTYTFVVEGGNNPDIPAKYHPFYISDDPVGGYEHKREEEKKVRYLILMMIFSFSNI